jgi:hypothetical protein
LGENLFHNANVVLNDLRVFAVRIKVVSLHQLIVPEHLIFEACKFKFDLEKCLADLVCLSKQEQFNHSVRLCLVKKGFEFVRIYDQLTCTHHFGLFPLKNAKLYVVAEKRVKVLEFENVFGKPDFVLFRELHLIRLRP